MFGSVLCGLAGGWEEVGCMFSKSFLYTLEKLVISLYFKLKGCVIDWGIIIMPKFI